MEEGRSERMRYGAMLLGCVALMGGLVGACGDDDDGGGGGSGGSSSDSGETGSHRGREGHRPRVDGGREGRGHLLHRQGHLRRAEGVRQALQRAEPGQRAHREARRVPGRRADEQRNAVRPAPGGEVRASATSSTSDVVWTAEFASQKLALRHDAVRRVAKAEFIPATLDTVNYDGKTWARPEQSDAGFLYYRTDQVDSVAGRRGRRSTTSRRRTTASSTRAPPTRA